MEAIGFDWSEIKDRRKTTQGVLNMSIRAPTYVFLRLEGPLQAWGDNSKFVIRRTMEAPTKSGVIGLICCAMGLSRQARRPVPLIPRNFTAWRIAL